LSLTRVNPPNTPATRFNRQPTKEMGGSGWWFMHLGFGQIWIFWSESDRNRPMSTPCGCVRWTPTHGLKYFLYKFVIKRFV
jgi:hypothetical protein